MLKKIISGLLKQIGNDISTGNCNMSETEMLEVIDHLKSITSPYISKYQACKYLNISRAKFDNLVKEGKLPKGIKRAGFKELFYDKRELDKYLKDITISK